ncbi:hypothetical protein FACS1894170_00520 [Planctomycetales bacterium]|nr:hypothetical protein FACS1894170_00520 [Planctomycetales bacterium]
MQQVYFFGKLASMNRKKAADFVRLGGDSVAKELADDVNIVVIGDEQLLEDDWNGWNDKLDAATRRGFVNRTLKVITETAFCELYCGQTIDRQCYTAVELARLHGLPLAVVHRFERNKLIIPVITAEAVAQFDRDAVLTLKIAAKMLEAGLSLDITENRLCRLQELQRHCLPNDVSIDGKTVLLSVPDGVIDHTGQHRIVFNE